MTNIYKRQPVRQLLAEREIGLTQAAQQMDVKRSHLINVLAGRVTPSLKLRERLPLLLGVTLEECFDAETLAKQYSGPRGLAGGRYPKNGVR